MNQKTLGAHFVCKYERKLTEKKKEEKDRDCDKLKAIEHIPAPLFELIHQQMI